MLIPAILWLQLAAPPAQQREAERLVHASIGDYDLGAFERALQEAEEAYRLDQLPQILFNIGQCHRALKHWEKAGFFFRRYLEKLPHAANRIAVEDLITQVDYRLKLEQLPSPAPPASAPAPVLSASATPSTTAAASSEAPPSSAHEVAPAPPRRSHALAGTLIAAGSAAAVVALVGLGEVVDFDSVNSTFQVSPTLANYNAARAASGRAALWAPTAIACGIGAALLGAGVAVAW